MTKTVSIIGLGYVGLPLAFLCAKKGIKVIGIDIDSNKVNKLNKGISPINDEYLIDALSSYKISATTDMSQIAGTEIVIICVPTPVTNKHIPDLSYVENACKDISVHLKKSQLVVLESTVYPGTTEDICIPILEQSGLKAGTDFFVAHCPERIDPGNKKWTVDKIPRVVGGINRLSTEKTAEFYRLILNAEVVELKSSKEAEATKIMENTFRDVNIAFVNEMAKSFDKAGIDITEVIRGASTKPFGFMPHYPGAGVGGHCISIDPYYLIDNAKTYGFDHQFLTLARKINNSMPKYTVTLLMEELNKLGKSVKGAKIGLLGLAYKGDVDDIRESPALEIKQLLEEKGAYLTVFDPYLINMSTVKSIQDALEQSEYIVLVTNHSAFLTLTGTDFAKHNIKLVIDGRNCLNKEEIQKQGIRYKGIGR